MVSLYLGAEFTALCRREQAKPWPLTAAAGCTVWVPVVLATWIDFNAAWL